MLHKTIKRSLANIRDTSLNQHVSKGETDFTIKQKNGNLTHFKLPPQQNKRLDKNLQSLFLI